MNAWMHRKENLFDFRRGHSLTVVADADVQPLSDPAGHH
jgi:hypothetical protein